MATFNLANQILIVNPSANVDSTYGPYNTVAEANTAIVSGLRVIGRTVGIITDGSVVEYWWKNGILDTDLIEKTATPVTYIARHDFESPYDYLGKALTGSSESSNVWTIKRLTISSNGSSIIQSATNVAWTNRLTATYT